MGRPEAPSRNTPAVRRARPLPTAPTTIQHVDMDVVIGGEVPPSYGDSLGDEPGGEGASELNRRDVASPGRWREWGESSTDALRCPCLDKVVEKRGAERQPSHSSTPSSPQTMVSQDTIPPSANGGPSSSIMPTPAGMLPAPPVPPTYHVATSSPQTPRSVAQWNSSSSIKVPLSPTSLSLTEIGSRFVPHSTATITSLLPLPEGLVLLGTTEGLRCLSVSDGTSSPVWTGSPVWDMRLLRSLPGNKGSVLVHCGGTEDGSSGRPKKDAEARIYKLESLHSLAKWTRAQTNYGGLELEVKKKGKGLSLPFSKPETKRSPSDRAGEELARAWAGNYTTLSATNVLAVTTQITPNEINLGMATPNSIVVHTGTATPNGQFAFAAPQTFYIPFAPSSISFIEMEIMGTLPEVRQDNESSLFEWDDAESIMDIGEATVGATLGVFCTFPGARGCVIRTGDSGVVELKKGGRGEWHPVQKVMSGDVEVYLFTRGSETFIFPVSDTCLPYMTLSGR